MIKAGNILRTRFVEYKKFHEIISRVHREATSDQIIYLFRVLSQTHDTMGYTKSTVDLLEFLMLLKLSGTDSRRSYDDKTSKVSNEVEFWNQKRAVSAGIRPSTACAALRGQEFNYKKKSNRSSKGALNKERLSGGPVADALGSRESLIEKMLLTKSHTSKDDFKSVAESLGVTHRVTDSTATGGRNVLGTMTNQAYTNSSVAEMLNSPAKHRQRHTTCGVRQRSEFAPEPSCQFSSNPREMQFQMNQGTGVAQLVFSQNNQKSSITKSENNRCLMRASSTGMLDKELRNRTSVPQALGQFRSLE